MAFATPYQDKLYYGRYGGCFISDAFTINCDKLYEDYKRITAQPDFWTACQELAGCFAPAVMRVETRRFFGKDIMVHEIGFNPYPIIGHALMAKKIGRQLALFAPRHIDEAIFCAKVGAYLGLRLKMNLPLSLRSIETLTQWLEMMEVELETKLCETFDLPEMYAFQQWVAAPNECYCIYSRSNVGAFPATLMTTDFASPYGTALKELVDTPDAIVVPCVSGSTALTVLKPWFGSNVKLYSVEISAPDMWEELDSFCGAFTKVMRNRTQDRVIAPELANAWDEGLVKRVFVEKKDAVITLKKNVAEKKADLSVESAAALHYASRLNKNVLVVCGALRMGTSL